MGVVLTVGYTLLDAPQRKAIMNETRYIGDFSAEGRERRLDSMDAYPNDFILDPAGDPKYSEADNKYMCFVHVILIGYMFLGLNTVCDIYFTGALDVMVEKWEVIPDVAGATFMAAGGSAPELFTSLIGAVLTEDEVGFGTIVGSAVFNVLAVIGMCGLAAKSPIPLTWWPLARDCSYYIMGLSVLAAFAKTGQEIQLWEAIVLFVLYLFYCLFMYFNERCEKKVKGWLYGSKKKDEDDYKIKEIKVKPGQVAPMDSDGKDGSQEDSLRNAGSAGSDKLSPPTNEVGEVRVNSKNHIRVAHFDAAKRSGGSKNPPAHGDGAPGGDDVRLPVAGANGSQGTEENEPADNTEPEMEPEGEDEPSDEDDAENDIEELMTFPDEIKDQILWIISLPIYAPLYYLTPVPDEKWFLATFVISLLWIAGYSYFLVWWVVIICNILNINTIIAGLTVLAAGTSIPDLVSSMAVARAGEGDMAVSSSIGSNIFDILVGLPIPWIVKIGLVELDASFTVVIGSAYIVFFVLLLLFMVMMVVVSIHWIGWKLNKALGACMAGLYALFLVVAVYVQLAEPAAFAF